MNGWNDYLMKQEQYRDQLLGAERHRLAKMVAGELQESASGQTVRTLVSGMRRRSRSHVPCGEYNCLLEKVA